MEPGRQVKIRAEEEAKAVAQDQAAIAFVRVAEKKFLTKEAFPAILRIALSAVAAWCGNKLDKEKSLKDEVLENHKKLLARKQLYETFGYDADKERDFIIERSKPFGGKILEAGTGKGHFALALARQGYRFVTFDISEEEQKFAKLNLAYFGFEKAADFKVEDGEKLSFPKASFDTVFSVNTIHHLRDPFRVMDELIRVLSREGKLVLSDFTAQAFNIMDKVHALEGNTHEVGKTTLSDIELYLKKSDFSVKKADSAHQHVLIATRSVK